MISETRRRLKEWGKWASDPAPSYGSMFKARSGGKQDLSAMPPHIMEIDHIVCTAPPRTRRILCGFYGANGSYFEKAERLSMPRSDMKRAVDRADYYVHSRLDEVPRDVVSSVYPAGLRRKTAHARPFRGVAIPKLA